MLVRIILVTILVWVTLEYLRRTFASKRPRERSRPEVGGRLVRCSSCGVHIPQNRALKAYGNHEYCSEACLKLGKTAAQG